MYRKLVLIAFVFIACIDFDIDAPYDDINAIYLEHVISYDFWGKKIEVENEKGYILSLSGISADIVCYDFADVYHIDTVGLYQSVYPKPDFVIADGYAYIVSQNLGLEIVDFRQTDPRLTGFLRIYGPLYSIALSNSNVYIAGYSELYTIDVSDVTNPVSIAEYTFDDSIVHFEVESDYLHILFREGTFQIIDISNPTNPNLVSEHNLSDTLDTADYFTTHYDYLYVTKGYGLDTYEIQGDGALEYQNTLSFSHPITFLKAYENFGLCLRSDAVYLLNLEYPSRPCIGEALELPTYTIHGVINGQYIYLSGHRLLVVEIKDIEQ